MGDLKYVSKDHGYILLLIVFEQNRGLFALKKVIDKNRIYCSNA